MCELSLYHNLVSVGSCFVGIRTAVSEMDLHLCIVFAGLDETFDGASSTGDRRFSP